MKRLVALLGMMLVAGLVVPAQASHPTRLCIDIGGDQFYPTSNDDVVDTITARLGVSDSNHPPQPGCFTDPEAPAGVETNIDFEITGVADPDSSDTPESPDMTCTIPAEEQACSVEPPSSGGGDQVTRAWVDDDKDDATVEADRAEDFDEEQTPGDESEPDFTDVTLWSWSHGDPAQCGDGSDNDGDTYIDYPDDPGCDSEADNTEYREEPPDDRRYATTVTIKRDSGGRRLSGLVYSVGRGCRHKRVVIVMKVRPGVDRSVRETESRYGKWTLLKPARLHGQVYAVAPKTQFTSPNGGFRVCARDKSPPISVRK